MKTNLTLTQFFRNACATTPCGERPSRAQQPSVTKRRLKIQTGANIWTSLRPRTGALRFSPSGRKLLPAILACLLGFLLPARGQDPAVNPTYPLNTNVSLGATVSFRAYASTAYPPLTYQWQHDGANVPAATNTLLAITNLTVADAGGYVAWVTNAIGGVTNTRTAILNVDPTFTKIMTGAIITDTDSSASASWADYDNNGYVDLFVANTAYSGSTRNTLYFNSGGTNYLNNAATNFNRVATSPFTTDYMITWAAAWADYNNDGHVDLVVGNLNGGSLAQRLYRNNGNGTFTAVSDSALLSDTKSASCPWWIDYDNDGFLDLFVVKGNYSHGVANDCLFHNNGDGTFRKMTAAEVGPIVNDQKETGWGFSVDYDDDGRQELSAIHDVQGGNSTNWASLTWLYQADGTFQQTTPVGISLIDTWWGDFDNDGRLDLFTSDPLAAWGPCIFRGLGGGAFTKVPAAFNMTKAVVVNTAALGDYDNDGWLDVFHVGDWWNANYIDGMFHNNRDGTFTQVLTGSLVYDGGRQIFPSWVDYNNDGFLDLFIPRGNAEPQSNLLYRNNGNTNHWLKVKLDGRASNRSGIHARVRVQATIDGQTFWQMREISCETSYIGLNGLLAHFGLGDATNVTTLRIEWPSGIVQELPNVPANQFLTVVESQGYPGPAPQLSVVTNTASGLQLSITEPVAPARYILEASTNLVNWTKLLARTSTGVTTNYTDARATNYARRFYRLQVP
jgi:enediyne biosynthesis protein E4